MFYLSSTYSHAIVPTHEDSSGVIWGSVSCPTELADAEWKSMDQRNFDLTEIKEKESGRDQKPTTVCSDVHLAAYFMFMV